jgi:hypothetical protein
MHSILGISHGHASTIFLKRKLFLGLSFVKRIKQFTLFRTYYGGQSSEPQVYMAYKAG